MVERGLYYATNEFAKMIRAVGGEWNDTKRRPIVCLVKSKEDERLYWAIPMGNLNHRSEEQKKRLEYYIGLPEKDIRSCYYHIGRTTTRSIFFISDAIPITEKYIETEHLGADNKPFVIKNPKLIQELERKLYRILSMENSKKNCYRQHITDVKKHLLEELNSEDAFYSEQNQVQLRRAMEQLEEGRVVTKTIEELEVLAES